jgi:protein ImuA
MSVAAETLDALRMAVARIEAADGAPSAAQDRVAFGIPDIDEALGGGLRRGTVHAVTGASAAGSVAATGFAVALAVRAAQRGGAVLWIRQDMAGRENGEPWPMGLAEFGLDPARLVMVRARNEEAVLRAAEAALACPGLSSALIEPFGRLAGFDRVAVRRLVLAAGRSGVVGLIVCADAPSQASPVGFSAAETRWRVRPAASDPAEEGWGRPRFAVELVRNRRGGVGRWTLGWDGDERGFHLLDPVVVAGAGRGAADPRDRAAQPADRPHPPAGGGLVLPLRRAG